MKCEKIQEMILTDYLDNCLNAEMREKVDSHLGNCVGCRSFLEVARQASIDPFEKSQKIEISQKAVWGRIQEEIAKENHSSEESFLDVNWRERIKAVFSFPRLAYILGPVCAFIFILFVVNQWGYVNQKPVVAQEEQQQVEYLAYLLIDEDTTAIIDDSGETDTELNAYYL